MKETVIYFGVELHYSLSAGLIRSLFLNALTFFPFSNNTGSLRFQYVVLFNPQAFCFWRMAPLFLYKVHVDTVYFVPFAVRV